MQRFQHTIKILPADIDEMGHVNNVVYVRWVQEVAAAHWHSVATDALRSRYLWVVLRHEIDYRNPAFLTDTILGTTWVGIHNGAKFERFVTLQNQEGKAVAEAKTLWCMLDGLSMRPTRITGEVLALL
jgi:acyl-CoA thioester hydrolase